MYLNCQLTFSVKFHGIECCYLDHTFCVHHKTLPSEVPMLLPVQNYRLGSMGIESSSCHASLWSTLLISTLVVCPALVSCLVSVEHSINGNWSESLFWTFHDSEGQNNDEVNMQMSSCKRLKYTCPPTHAAALPSNVFNTGGFMI